jgi:hypothetical protein
MNRVYHNTTYNLMNRVYNNTTYNLMNRVYNNTTYNLMNREYNNTYAICCIYVLVLHNLCLGVVE